MFLAQGSPPFELVTGRGADQLEIAVTRRWRVLLLWAGLTGAIALVGWLVSSLMREMKQG